MAVRAIASFLSHDKIKRLLALGAFVFGLVVLRHLATLLVFALVLTASLGFVARKLSGWTRIGEKVWVLGLVLLVLAGGGLVAYSGALRTIPIVNRAVSEARSQAERFKQSGLYKTIQEAHLDPERFGKQIEKLGHKLTHGLQITGRALIHLALALILAVLYLTEREQVDPIFARLPQTSFFGYLMSFYRFLCEAVILTVKVQVIVALVNAVVTLPVMLALGLPHVLPLMVLVFIFGLVPVIGNFMSGLVLVVLSYMTRGWLGVGIFLASTFVLHKIEAYYLNPRLVAKHVQLPSLLLIVSLIIWEHLIGLAGLFVSFPALYVTMRIRDLFATIDVGNPEPETAVQLDAANSPSEPPASE